MRKNFTQKYKASIDFLYPKYDAYKALSDSSLSGLLNILEDTGFSEKSGEFGSLNTSLCDCTSCIACDHSNFELFRIGFVHVHGFSEHLGCQDSSLLQSQLLCVVILQIADGIHAVFARSMSLPCCIVARWIRAVELEALDGVPAGVHEGDSEGAATAHLGVDVLLVGEESHELLAVDGGSLAVDVPLAVQAALVDQHVRVGHHSRYRHQNVVVHLVQLPALTSWNEQVGSLFLLRSENNT